MRRKLCDEGHTGQHHVKGRWIRNTLWVVCFVCLIAEGTRGGSGGGVRMLQVGREKTSYEHSPDHVCLSVHNHPLIHDKRKDVKEAYETIWNQYVEHNHTQYTDEKPLPAFHSFPRGGNAHFVVWSAPRGQMRASAWDDTTTLNYRGYIPPLCEDAKEKVDGLVCNDDDNNKYVHKIQKEYIVEGDLFGYTAITTYEGHYGHYKHDMLPNIAYFRSTLPQTTRLVLLDVGHNRETIEFIDPVFSKERVVWVQYDEMVTTVRGTLSVAKAPYHPYVMYHNLLNPLRAWIQERHPRVPQEAEQRTIVYYRRLQSTSKKGRVLNQAQEDDVLMRIRHAMKRYNRKERLVIFTGVNHRDGRDLSLPEQYRLFRSARTIIGPHGTGLGGNLLWIDPSPPSCADRVQLLEFITDGSEELKQVHGSYTSHYYGYRGLPLNYHNLFYLRNSTHAETYIDADLVDEFLHNVWGSEKEEEERVAQE